MFSKHRQAVRRADYSAMLRWPMRTSMGWFGEPIAQSGLPVQHVQALHPRICLPLSSSASGCAIGQHIASSSHGARIGDALAVLALPPSMDEYLRGKSRQAVRTNIRRSNDLGYNTSRVEADQFCRQVIAADKYGQHFRWIDMLIAELPTDDMQHWLARNRAGWPVAAARVQIDRNIAWIKYLVSTECARNSGIRYKLSADIFAYLISKDVNFCIVGSTYNLDSGLKYFQERLGFRTMSIIDKP